MAVEPLRRSGYRFVGGLYLVSDTIFNIKPTIEIPTCKYCGQGPNLSRNITEFKHGDFVGEFLMIVGKHFYPTPASFIDEADKLGVSKRIPFLAKNLVLGVSKVYLAHPKAFHHGWGIFSYFIPDRVERLVWAKDYDLQYPNNQVIVRIPDGDMDHSPWRKKKLIEID